MSSIEDFFTSLQNERKRIEDEISESRAKVQEFLNFIISGKLFKDYGKFYTLLYQVQTIVTPLIQKLLTFEMGIKQMEAQTAAQEQPQEQNMRQQEQQKEGFMAKLASIIRRRRPQQKPQQLQKREELIEYGRNIIKRLDIVWREYRRRYYLIRFQDTESNTERKDYSELEFISYLSDVCADIITFVEAAHLMRIQEIESRYENMVRALTVSEAQQPLPSR